ncbi:MAG TPA: PilZ domain-containing protein [Spirochaetota bacterium]|nr:PilZ domain-containing protein [Spirochaetota bacterium]HPC42436.1 PilZ domain-containing protein [Spirochaetota bacterium]HPL18460.1 PilZ domain-containing protein [Spirochaetota bacterium]HQF06577.1 PilZ domain-containing protein [Spirochaetota bacterium]HQH96020.1 PilZ domain-containing protein [Spirochaetota bacterium]
MSRDECKRDFVRINNQFNVRIVAKDESARYGTREINTSRSINVSASGLLVNAAERIDKDSIVNITFMKPNTFDFFKGPGKVVRIDDNTDGTYKIAINFINLSHDDKQMLDYYIQLGAR